MLLDLIDRFSGRRHVEARRRKFADFTRLCRPTPQDEVLDVGVLGRETYDAANLFLKEYPHQERLTALAIEECSELSARYPLVRFVRYDGRRFPFADDSFAICHSNAVVEHVGDLERQRLFVSEMVRVANRGFFTTPNRWFPIELHSKLPLAHYLPWPLFIQLSRIVRREELVRGVRLLSKRQLAELAKRAGVSSFLILNNRVLGITVTYSVFWSK